MLFHFIQIVAIDINREFYEMGRPVIKKAGVEHKIDFIESEAILALDKLLEDVRFPRNIVLVFVSYNSNIYIYVELVTIYNL